VKSKWNAKARCGESRLHRFVRLTIKQKPAARVSRDGEDVETIESRAG